MPLKPLSRQLAVIVHADVVGSTTLVQQDETIAHQRILSAFNRFSEIIETYGGSTRELRGDALVAEYERASDAVAAALAFQLSNTTHNAALDDEIRPELRSGSNSWPTRAAWWCRVRSPTRFRGACRSHFTTWAIKT